MLGCFGDCVWLVCGVDYDYLFGLIDTVGLGGDGVGIGLVAVLADRLRLCMMWNLACLSCSLCVVEVWHVDWNRLGVSFYELLCMMRCV